jgi:hypothetical protein
MAQQAVTKTPWTLKGYNSDKFSPTPFQNHAPIGSETFCITRYLRGVRHNKEPSFSVNVDRGTTKHESAAEKFSGAL